MNLCRGPETRKNAWRRAARLEGLRPARGWRAPVRIDEGKSYANVAGRRYDLEVFDERLMPTRQADLQASQDASTIVRSPMPGLIVDVRVHVGDRVRAGSAVVVMEAMKMLNELICEVDGIVRAVNVKPRDSVESQAPLIEVTRAE
ncbi:MAG: acetyl-CoA carboxylase biotin carboxyl carrier protein subunit [Candidatus Aminicenantes bacterium]|jgi:biotin carboxyl carrier protein|nr:acetyl-CoA carboxylase biotin carboxyl carrier protein subunit [Candidatus Aminicenantes bacterium]